MIMNSLFYRTYGILSVFFVVLTLFGVVGILNSEFDFMYLIPDEILSNLAEAIFIIYLYSWFLLLPVLFLAPTFAYEIHTGRVIRNKQAIFLQWAYILGAICVILVSPLIYLINAIS